MHAPLPLQVEGANSVVPLQVGPEHGKPAAWSWHAPAPLQLPVLPHGGIGAQSLWGSEVLPTGAQVPAPLTLQAWQVPQPAVEQQTPSVQKSSLKQSLVVEHCWPRRNLVPQRLDPVSQMSGDRHWPSPEHAAKQAVAPLHR